MQLSLLQPPNPDFVRTIIYGDTDTADSNALRLMYTAEAQRHLKKLNYIIPRDPNVRRATSLQSPTPNKMMFPLLLL